MPQGVDKVCGAAQSPHPMLPSLDLGHLAVQALGMPPRPLIYPGPPGFVASAVLGTTPRVSPVQVLVQVGQPLPAANLLRQPRDLGSAQS